MADRLSPQSPAVLSNYDFVVSPLITYEAGLLCSKICSVACCLLLSVVLPVRGVPPLCFPVVPGVAVRVLMVPP